MNEELLTGNEQLVVNVKVIGISVNTSNMENEKALEYLKQVEEEMKLPTVDPVLTGTSRLVEELDNF